MRVIARRIILIIFILMQEAIGRATGVDELIVCDEAPGTSFEDYTRFDLRLG